MLVSNVAGHGWASLYQFGEERGITSSIREVFQVKSLSEFTRKVSTVVDKVDCSGYDGSLDLEEAKNKFKGDLFEVFTVMFMNSVGGDRHYRILGLEWASRDQAGYDFTAIDHKGNPVLLQSKYRSNPGQEFESNQLETFLAEGNNFDEVVQRVLFTNSTKISSRYKRFEREGNMRIIDGSQIKKHAGVGFWKYVDSLSKKLF